MQPVIILATVSLTVALLVLIVYAIRALSQLTLTIQRLDAAIERSSRTMDHLDAVLGEVRGRLVDMEGMARTLNAAHEFVLSVGGGALRRASGPAMSIAGIGLAAMKGVETFLNYRSKPKEGDGHE
ncbi:MAG: hypothetical protein HZB25_00705 [Candidatus Eisenbacteria bacterium]|nr:hypothetical protein [Candidatus Eisenbacteria bacterium]